MSENEKDVDHEAINASLAKLQAVCIVLSIGFLIQKYWLRHTFRYILGMWSYDLESVFIDQGSRRLTKAQLLVATPDDLIQDLGNILQQPIIIKDMKSSQFVQKVISTNAEISIVFKR